VLAGVERCPVPAAGGAPRQWDAGLAGPGHQLAHITIVVIILSLIAHGLGVKPLPARYRRKCARDQRECPCRIAMFRQLAVAHREILLR